MMKAALISSLVASTAAVSQKEALQSANAIHAKTHKVVEDLKDFVHHHAAKTITANKAVTVKSRGVSKTTRPTVLRTLRGKGGKGKGKGKGGKGDKEEWIPCTKLGRLVKDGKIRNIDDIFYFSMPVKEYQIIDFFIPGIKDEVMKIHPVQKQTTAGQRTRFVAYVVVGDNNGHVGLGKKAAKEVAGAIGGAIINAKLNLVPVARGHWGNKIGAPHTIPCKVHGKCGSIRIRMIPAPRGTGLVAAKIPKKVLGYAGVEDCFTSSRGSTATGGNFVKAVFEAIKATYQYNAPDMWEQVDLGAKKPPFQEFTDYLKTAEIKAPVVKTIF